MVYLPSKYGYFWYLSEILGVVYAFFKKTPHRRPQQKKAQPHLHGVSNAEASSDDGGHIETCISNLRLGWSRHGHHGHGGGLFWWIFKKTQQKTGFCRKLRTEYYKEV